WRRLTESSARTTPARMRSRVTTSLLADCPRLVLCAQAQEREEAELDTQEFELADGCKERHRSKDIVIFHAQEGVSRAVFRIDQNEDPLPHADPNRFGYALTMINFIDGHEGVAICEVVNIRQFLSGIEEWEAEIIDLV